MVCSLFSPNQKRIFPEMNCVTCSCIWECKGTTNPSLNLILAIMSLSPETIWRDIEGFTVSAGTESQFSLLTIMVNFRLNVKNYGDINYIEATCNPCLDGRKRSFPSVLCCCGLSLLS